MALPSSLPISMAQIYAEFGGSGQPLTAFVRGGAYVPNISANAGIPTSPPISISQFIGATANDPNIKITNQTFGYSGGGVPSVVTYSLIASSGIASIFTSGAGSNPIAGEWLVAGPGTGYQARATLLSGALTNGTSSPLSTWLAIGPGNGDAVWGLQRSAVGTDNAAILVEIRNASTGVVVASATITMSATRTF